MAVTITVAELVAALRLTDSTEETAEVARLLEYATEAVVKYAPKATDAAHNEAVRRVVGHLHDQPEASMGDAYANAMRSSGAARALLPYRIHRAGLANAVSAAQAAVGTPGNPVTNVEISGLDLIVTFADGTTDTQTLPAGGVGTVDTTARAAAGAAQSAAQGAQDAADAAQAEADANATAIARRVQRSGVTMARTQIATDATQSGSAFTFTTGEADALIAAWNAGTYHDLQMSIGSATGTWWSPFLPVMNQIPTNGALRLSASVSLPLEDNTDRVELQIDTRQAANQITILHEPGGLSLSGYTAKEWGVS